VRGEEERRWIVIASITARLPDDLWASLEIQEGRRQIVGAATQVSVAS
jgi:hypothetical protein